MMTRDLQNNLELPSSQYGPTTIRRDHHNMESETGSRMSQSPCRLFPPCKQGNHGSSAHSTGECGARPIGKYYFTEDALIHDLAALERGALYDSDEFYKRAKAWYKAEIDRLLHLEKAKEVGIIKHPIKSRRHHNPCSSVRVPVQVDQAGRKRGRTEQQ
jgi:hypothetical protein